MFAETVPGSLQGYVLFGRENNLLALPFDARTAQATGATMVVARGVSVALANAGYAPFSASGTRVVLYWSGTAAGGTNQIVWYDRSGKILGSPLASGNVLFPVISPDEKVVAFTRPRCCQLRHLAARCCAPERHPFVADGRKSSPVWSPDGKRVVVTSGAAFGTLNERSTTEPTGGTPLTASISDRSEQWRRDGRFIVFSRLDPKTNLDLWLLPMTNGPEERKPRPFMQTEFNEYQGQISPDSHWIAYTSDESGQREVFIRSFPSADGKWKLSTTRREQPRWRADGKELFYVDASGKINAVLVKPTATSPNPDLPVPLFDPHLVGGTNIYNVFQYDVTNDRKRFVAATNIPSDAAPPSTVVISIGRRN
jgi:hypothetical protein